MKKQLKIVGKGNNTVFLWVTLGVLLSIAGIILYKQIARRTQIKQTIITLPTTPTPTTMLSTPTFAPTPTLAPGQTAIYTFYIQASPNIVNREGLGLKRTDTGKIFTVGVGTFISLDFGSGKYHASFSSPQNIFNCAGSECLPHSSPRNSISSFWVSRAGFGTIQVIETD